MLKIRSVSGHVSPVCYLKPAPLGSIRITRLHRYYGHLRLPAITALVLAVQACSRVRAVHAPTTGSPRLPRNLVVRLDTVCDPGWTTAPCQDAAVVVACWCLETIGPLQLGHFGTKNLHGRLYPLPLRLACFAAYASSSALPLYLQGCILGLWLAVTKAGFAPARLRDIALPQPRLDPFSL